MSTKYCQNSATSFH